MNYRTATVVEFRTRLGFNQNDLITTKEHQYCQK